MNHPRRGIYLDRCHPSWRTKAAVHGVLFVLSMFAWTGLALLAILAYRWLVGL